MTATPLHMHLVNKFTLFETSIVIQLHVIGMFLPSLFSGDLIKRFGNTNIININVKSHNSYVIERKSSNFSIFHILIYIQYNVKSLIRKILQKTINQS